MLDAHSDGFRLTAGIGDVYRREHVALARLCRGSQANRASLHANPNTRLGLLRKGQERQQGEHA